MEPAALYTRVSTNDQNPESQLCDLRQMASPYIDTLPMLHKEMNSSRTGVLRFVQSQSMWTSNRGQGWGR